MENEFTENIIGTNNTKSMNLIDIREIDEILEFSNFKKCI